MKQRVLFVGASSPWVTGNSGSLARGAPRRETEGAYGKNRNGTTRQHITKYKGEAVAVAASFCHELRLDSAYIKIEPQQPVE